LARPIKRTDGGSMNILNEYVDEKMRLKLIAESLVLRSKQPEAWTKTKYRKNIRPRKVGDVKSGI